jgi:hypothetical protein
MKTLHNKIKIAVGVFLLAALAVSCIPKQETMGDAGQTIIKLNPESFSLVPFDAKSTAQSGVLFEVRRDANSEAALNSTSTVTLQYDTDGAILGKYNDANETSFIPLPANLGTTEPAVTGGTITLNFAAGEFSKGVMVNIPNASAFDFTKQYAFAFKLTEVSGTGVKSQAINDTIVAQVMVKNKYDGKYEVTALSPMIDIVVNTLTGWYPFTFELETSGEHSVKCLLTDPGYYNYYHPITSGGTYSVYGTFGLEIFFDPSGNGNIINVKNPFGNPPANTRMPVIDPSGVNKWDPATKNILFKYWMKQPSLVPAAPNIRTWFDEKWTYKGPR